MAIDASIAMGGRPAEFESPTNALTKILQIRQAQQGLDKGQMEQDQYRTAKARSNRLIELNRELGDVDADKRGMAYRKEGYLSEADSLQKGELERRKIGSEADSKDMDTSIKAVQQFRDFVTMAKNPQEAGILMQIMHADPRFSKTPIGKVPLEIAMAQIGQDPESFNEWKTNFAFNTGEFIKENKPTYQKTSSGKVDQILALPGLGGAPTVVNTTMQTTTPGQDQSSRDAALSRGNSMKIAEMSDQRARDLNETAREANRITQDNKPLTEGQSKSALFGSRMQEANDILDTLAKGGETVSNIGMNAGYGIGAVRSATSSNEQQQLMQAKRNFVNAVLRRESGAVIADSEFANAEKQYFPQIGDTPQVIAQKKTNREAATRGVLIDVPESRRERIVSDIRGPKATQAANPQDAQALAWANANPSDPRSAQIKKRLGQ